jgi:ABC-type polysaccharide/polyol phosphate export permease
MKKIINKGGAITMIVIGLIMAFLFTTYLEGAIELGAIQLFIEFIVFAIIATILFSVLSHYFPSLKVLLWSILFILLFIGDCFVFWPYRGILR